MFNQPIWLLIEAQGGVQSCQCHFIGPQCSLQR
ncbi:hypothetical protein YPPY100_4509, partial [Yersinia pestis PY-100]